MVPLGLHSPGRAVCSAGREQTTPFCIQVTGTFWNHRTLGSLQHYPVANSWLGLCEGRQAHKGLPNCPYQRPGREEEPGSQWSPTPGSKLHRAIWNPVVANLLLATSHLPSFSVTSCPGAISPLPHQRNCAGDSKVSFSLSTAVLKCHKPDSSRRSIPTANISSLWHLACHREDWQAGWSWSVTV